MERGKIIPKFDDRNRCLLIFGKFYKERSFDHFNRRFINPRLFQTQPLSQAGTINGMRFIGCLLGGPFWGWLADQKRWHRPLIIIVTMCALLLQLSQPFVTEHMGPEHLNRCPMKTNLTYQQREELQRHSTPAQVLEIFFEIFGHFEML